MLFKILLHVLLLLFVKYRRVFSAQSTFVAKRREGWSTPFMGTHFPVCAL
jgi:hypothetical protein